MRCVKKLLTSELRPIVRTYVLGDSTHQHHIRAPVLPQNLFAQLLFFQQVPELAHGSLIGHRLAA
jgi:hypothetical protein